MNDQEVKQLKQSRAQAQLVTHLQSLALREEKKKCEGLEKKVEQLKGEITQWKQDEEYNESVLENYETIFEKLIGMAFQGKPGSLHQTLWFEYLDRDGREYIIAKNMEEINKKIVEEFQPEAVRIIKPKKRDNLVIEIEEHYRTARATDLEMLERQTERFKRWKK